MLQSQEKYSSFVNILSFLHIFIILLEITLEIWYSYISFMINEFRGCTMIPKEEFKPTFLSILVLSCVVFAPISFLINFICGISITPTTLLQLWASLLIFVIAFFIALIITFSKKVNYKKRLINYFAITYTPICFVLNIFVMFVEGTKVWSVYSLYLVVGYSIIIAALRTYGRFNNYLLSTLIYYAVSIIAFIILTVAIAEYSEGYQIMISLGIFSVCYTAASISYFFVKRSIAQAENEEKAYKPMFD